MGIAKDMKGKEKIGIWMICLIWVLVAGCSHSEDDAAVPVNKDVKTRLLTFTQVENRGSRAVLNEDDHGLSALWKRGDQLGCCNLKLEESIMTLGGISTGTLKALDDKVKNSIFQGEMTCEQNDQLAVIYPFKDFGFGLEHKPEIRYFVNYTITLSGQNGSLATLASDYHYMYGLATVNSVTSTTAEASGKMKSLLAVCKFSFKDENNNGISVKKLEISYVYDGSGGNRPIYPQSAIVKFYEDGSYSINPVVPNDDDGVPLIINLKQAAEAVYVALLPVTTRTFRFEVTDDNGGTYTGKAMATLQAGEYVVASLPVKK
ncbi:MAG: hypothetical protein II947_07730 [Bacteroidaceae bacterium]|nr:hypothetical protein [Bacteroidaceae bacterium]